MAHYYNNTYLEVEAVEYPARDNYGVSLYPVQNYSQPGTFSTCIYFHSISPLIPICHYTCIEYLDTPEVFKR